ncbi:MAG: TolB family protein [Bdellovibrio sp.]
MKRSLRKFAGFFAVLNFLVINGIGCSHKEPVKETLKTPYFADGSPRQITFFGDNEHPRFSKDGTKILFNSRGRNGHKGSQIYELDLLNNKERRVVYSDGDAFDANYISDLEILYSSTTDEIKENPLSNKSSEKDYPPSDLYMSDIRGNDILRLTMQPSFDGEAAFYSHPQSPYILFTSRRGDVTGIYRLDLENLPVSLVAANNGKERRYPVFTPDQKAAVWVEKDLKSNEQKIVLYNLKTKVTTIIKSGDGEYRDLFFAPRNPHRLFYSVLRNGATRYQIEVFDLKNQCTQLVQKSTDSLLFPVVSNDNLERLAYVRIIEHNRHIFLMNLPSDLGPCIETANQANLKE